MVNINSSKVSRYGWNILLSVDFLTKQAFQESKFHEVITLPYFKELFIFTNNAHKRYKTNSVWTVNLNKTGKTDTRRNN